MLKQLPSEVLSLVCDWLNPKDIHCLSKYHDHKGDDKRREWGCRICGEVLFEQDEVVGVVGDGKGIVLKGWKGGCLKWMGKVGRWELCEVDCGGCGEVVGMGVGIDEEIMGAVVEREWVDGIGGVEKEICGGDVVRCDGCLEVLGKWDWLKAVGTVEGVWDEQVFLFENLVNGIVDVDGVVCCQGCGDILGNVVKNEGRFNGMAIVSELAISTSVRMRRRSLELQTLEDC